jgi:hypothetical protein
MTEQDTTVIDWSRRSVPDKAKESVTFRVESRLLATLKHEAEQRHVSLNTLVGQIFVSFVEWEMNAHKAGWMILPKEVVKSAFTSLDDDKIMATASLAAIHAKEANLAMMGVDSFDAYYTITKNRLLRCGFHITEQKGSDSIRLNIQHSMGEKWSAYFKEQCQRVIENFGYRCKVTTTENTASIEVSHR